MSRVSRKAYPGLSFASADREGRDGLEQRGQHVLHEHGAAVLQQHHRAHQVFCRQHAPVRGEPVSEDRGNTVSGVGGSLVSWTGLG